MLFSKFFNHRRTPPRRLPLEHKVVIRRERLLKHIRLILPNPVPDCGRNKDQEKRYRTVDTVLKPVTKFMIPATFSAVIDNEEGTELTTCISFRSCDKIDTITPFVRLVSGDEKDQSNQTAEKGLRQTPCEGQNPKMPAFHFIFPLKLTQQNKPG